MFFDELSNEEWAQVAPLVTEGEVREHRRGRPRAIGLKSQFRMRMRNRAKPSQAFIRIVHWILLWHCVPNLIKRNTNKL